MPFGYRLASVGIWANEYASYQNTLGRRSTLVGPYTHMSKYSYPTDVSLSSHYGYTSWGLWRDSRNLSSSLYAKKQKNIKSFSILLMSAAFIVVLAVLCVAGLAFYFSTFKADLSETILAFDCTFRVARGDIYTTGLRTNSTPVYRQKTAFYEKLIETSLERSGLTVSRTEIMNFGDGPTIALSFRVFLDMRKIKITINNVEEHIRTAFLSEVLNPSSTFKNIRIDPDSIEIKRLLDQEVLKTALLTRNEPFPSVVKPTGGGSDQEQRHVTKKTGVIEKTIHKFTPRVTPPPPTGSRLPVDGSKGIVEAESDIDMDNLPVIQGSFEITKTDADITQKRTGSGGGSTDPAGRVPVVASTLKPFAVSPAQITVRGSEKTRVTEGIKATVAGTDEKPSTGGQGPAGRFGQNAGGKSKYETATAKIEKMDKHGATTKKIKTTSLKPSPSTGGGSAGRRSTTVNGMVGRTTTTTRSPTTTTTSTTTTTTTTIAPIAVRSTSAVSSKTPTQVASTTSRLTTLRYQVLASQGSSNEPSSMSGSASIGAWDEDEDESDEELRDESFAEDHLPVVVDVIGLPSETDGDIKNDTLLETIFQAIINDSIPEEFASDRRRIGGLEPDSIPKLDVNLFTSAPILDKQPWHPINPNQQQQVKADQRTGLPARKKVSLAEEILYRNRPSDIESVLAYTENPNGQIYYQSYTNPSFGSSTLGIEPLGVADVRPYPLPVDKIHEEVIPDFKYLTPTAVDASEQLLNLTLDE
uniref:SEA domain-containing protein n=1 Tax=Anopheles maculatus TaxID=74869 RepID=A0A182SDL0_9DIPT